MKQKTLKKRGIKKRKDEKQENNSNKERVPEHITEIVKTTNERKVY